MVPNALALGSAVSNSNSGALDEQISIKFTLPIQANHTLAMALAREATLCSPYTFLKKPVLVNLDAAFEWGHSIQHITVKAYVLDVRLEKKFITDVNIRVLDAFKAAGLIALDFVELKHAG